AIIICSTAAQSTPPCSSANINQQCYLILQVYSLPGGEMNKACFLLPANDGDFDSSGLRYGLQNRVAVSCFTQRAGTHCLDQRCRMLDQFRFEVDEGLNRALDRLWRDRALRKNVLSKTHSFADAVKCLVSTVVSVCVCDCKPDCIASNINRCDCRHRISECDGRR